MASPSMSLEEKIDALLKHSQEVTSSNRELRNSNQELKARNEYLCKQLGIFLKQKQKMCEDPIPSEPQRQEQMFNHSLDSSSEDELLSVNRQASHVQASPNEFKIEVPEFEGKLDPEDFLDWLHTVERIFEYKDIPDNKKVKLIALRLRKYASLWWTNLCAKRVRERKSKIRTWEKMKSKLKARFLPSTYVQDCYSQLHHLNQGNMSVEEYTREFEKLVIKCDLHEPEEQTIVRYLGGLDPRYSNIVELQASSTFDEVCVLAHKVEQQRKSKPLPKPENPKPPPQEQTFNKGSSPSPPFHHPYTSLAPQKSQTPQKNLFPPPTQKALPKNPPRCFKCQGFGHLASECTNRRFVTLAEWKATEEVPLEEEVENENHDKEEIEEIMVEADEGEELPIPHHPPKGKESRNVLFLSFGEPSTNLPPPSTPETLAINFCQIFFEPSFTPPNHTFKVCKKVVPGMFMKSPTQQLQISMGQEEERASKFMKELFGWLILFQPDLKRKGGYQSLI